jgi:hypothetical protein
MYAPQFNFELNEEQLIEKALERGFIKRSGSTGSKWNSEGGCTASEVLYEYNPGYEADMNNYKPITAEEVNKVIRDNGTDASEMVQDLVDQELYGEETE